MAHIMYYNVSQIYKIDIRPIFIPFFSVTLESLYFHEQNCFDKYIYQEQTRFLDFNQDFIFCRICSFICVDNKTIVLYFVI